MEQFLRSLGRDLPDRLREVLRWDFVPWQFVRDRHGDAPGGPLFDLLDAYRKVGGKLDLETLSSTTIPPDESGCRRCGSCCAHKRPGDVTASTYRWWLREKLPVAGFYSPDEDNPDSCTSWFNNGTRLRMCPFLLVNRVDGQPFCAIHHTGDENRPPACSAFRPDPPACQTHRSPLVP